MQPSRSNQPLNQNQSPAKTKKSKKSAKIAIVVVGAIVLLVGGYFAWDMLIRDTGDESGNGGSHVAQHESRDENRDIVRPPEPRPPREPASAGTPTTVPDPPQPPLPESPPLQPESESESEPEPEEAEILAEPEIFPEFDITQVSDIISLRTSPANVAVAVMDLNTQEIHMTENGGMQFVAAGFYAPIYSIAVSVDSSLRQSAGTMMETMSNATANTLINNIGGFAEVNSILTSWGYETSFSRAFGDVAASQRGIENYTTAIDAVRILERVYDDGGHLRMSFNLTGDGISLPGGAAFHAHRGLGIGDSFNVFAVVITPTGNYIVAILTNGLGNANAVSVISDLLENIQQQMVEINEQS
jgi:hypothetical protein